MLGGKNKQHRQPLGYTIVEIMIVLAVSGFMFVVAANFINGKQARTSFNQGVHEMASQVQNLIEQVTDGHYSDVPLNCAFNAGDTDASNSAVTAGQGENAPCVFLGKVMFFSQGTIGRYRIMSMAGGRIIPTSNDPSTALLNAGPVSVNSLLAWQSIPQNLTIWDITSTDPGGTPYSYRAHTGGGNWSTNALGFFQSQGAAADGTVTSGAQTISLYQVWGSTDSHGQYAPHAGTHVLESSSICITDGTRYAEVQIGTSRNASRVNPLTVSTKMDGTTPC